MELLEGETLASRLSRSPLPWREAAEIAAAVAEGLAAAHAKGIIHRDLKPGNIFLTSDGRVKVLDFGLARRKATLDSSSRRSSSSNQETTDWSRTLPGTVLGTVGYMSPEQVRGEKVDAPGDLFALGCVLYEMISGRRVFARASMADALAALLKEDPPYLTESGKPVPGELDWVVRRCLHKQAGERYQSAKELAAALKALVSQPVAGPSSQPASVATPARRLPARRVLWIGAAVVAAVAAVAGIYWFTQRSEVEALAVLPFTNVDKNPSAEYLSDGITEGIINHLSQLPNLAVMSRSSVFRYKGKDVDPQQVGRDLQVQAVLLGRVVQRGDDLSISAELVEVRSQRQIWGEQYNRKMADVQAVQEEIAREISDKLRLRLTGEDRRRMARRQTGNSEAYQLYLQGRFQWNKRTLEGMQQSIDLLQQSLQKDPRFALAHAGLADAYAVLAEYNVLPAREVMPRAKAAAAQALGLDDTLAEAHASLAWAKFLHDWAWPDAEREFRRALELNPNYAPGRHWYGEYLLAMGRSDQALAELQRAQELEPVNLVVHRALGSTLYLMGRPEQAVEQARKTLGLDPNFAGAHLLLGRAHEARGAFPEAITAYQKALEISEGNSNELAALGRAYAAAGKRAEAVKILAELKERSNQTYVQPVWIAVLHAALREKEEAFQWLQRGLEDRSGWLVYLRIDPVFAPLRSDGRFAELLRRVGLP
jgi:serine/threonine-protein kinase